LFQTNHVSDSSCALNGKTVTASIARWKSKR